MDLLSYFDGAIVTGASATFSLGADSFTLTVLVQEEGKLVEATQPNMPFEERLQAEAYDIVQDFANSILKQYGEGIAWHNMDLGIHVPEYFKLSVNKLIAWPLKQQRMLTCKSIIKYPIKLTGDALFDWEELNDREAE